MPIDEHALGAPEARAPPVDVPPAKVEEMTAQGKDNIQATDS